MFFQVPFRKVAGSVTINKTVTKRYTSEESFNKMLLKTVPGAWSSTISHLCSRAARHETFGHLETERIDEDVQPFQMEMWKVIEIRRNMPRKPVKGETGSTNLISCSRKIFKFIVHTLVKWRDWKYQHVEKTYSCEKPEIAFSGLLSNTLS